MERALCPEGMLSAALQSEAQRIGPSSSSSSPLPSSSFALDDSDASDEDVARLLANMKRTFADVCEGDNDSESKSEHNSSIHNGSEEEHSDDPDTMFEHLRQMLRGSPPPRTDVSDVMDTLAQAAPLHVKLQNITASDARKDQSEAIPLPHGQGETYDPREYPALFQVQLHAEKVAVKPTIHLPDAYRYTSERLTRVMPRPLPAPPALPSRRDDLEHEVGIEEEITGIALVDIPPHHVLSEPTITQNDTHFTPKAFPAYTHPTTPLEKMQSSISAPKDVDEDACCTPMLGKTLSAAQCAEEGEGEGEVDVPPPPPPPRRRRILSKRGLPLSLSTEVRTPQGVLATPHTPHSAVLSNTETLHTHEIHSDAHMSESRMETGRITAVQTSIEEEQAPRSSTVHTARSTSISQSVSAVSAVSGGTMSRPLPVASALPTRRDTMWDDFEHIEAATEEANGIALADIPPHHVLSETPIKAQNDTYFTPKAFPAYTHPTTPSEAMQSSISAPKDVDEDACCTPMLGKTLSAAQCAEEGEGEGEVDVPPPPPRLRRILSKRGLPLSLSTEARTPQGVLATTPRTPHNVVLSNTETLHTHEIHSDVHMSESRMETGRITAVQTVVEEEQAPRSSTVQTARSTSISQSVSAVSGSTMSRPLPVAPQGVLAIPHTPHSTVLSNTETLHTHEIHSDVHMSESRMETARITAVQTSIEEEQAPRSSTVQTARSTSISQSVSAVSAVSGSTTSSMRMRHQERVEARESLRVRYMEIRMQRERDAERLKELREKEEEMVKRRDAVQRRVAKAAAVQVEEEKQRKRRDARRRRKQADTHYGISLLRRYGFAQFRENVRTSQLERLEADTMHSKHLLARSVTAWRGSYEQWSKVRYIVTIFRAVQLARFLRGCFLRGMLRRWRGVARAQRMADVCARRAHRHTLVRSMWIAWKEKYALRVASSDIRLMSIADSAKQTFAARRLKNRFCDWKERAESRQAAVRRSDFRRRMLLAIGDSLGESRFGPLCP